MRIFYSWENDRLAGTTKNFIEKAFEKAIRELNQDNQFSNQESQYLKIDRDTKDTSGYPDILAEIREKIRNADGFLADLTYSVKIGKIKGIPNPNVIYELSYALTSLGDRRIITVMNTYYGNPDILPFDLKGRRWPIQYHLAPKANGTEKEIEMEKLKKQFKAALSFLLSLPEKGSLSALGLDDSFGNIYAHLKVSNNDEWSEIYESEPGLQQVYYHKSPNLRIVADIRPESVVEENYNRPWANCFLHQHARMYKAQIYYNATLINELFLISVDEGSALMPQPLTDSSGKIFRIPFLSYKIASLFNLDGKLDDYIDRANYILNKNNMSLSIWPSDSKI